MKNTIGYCLALLLAAMTPLLTATHASAEQTREQEVRDIGLDAYVYLYPLVTMDITRLQLTNVPEAKGFLGPMNAFNSFRAFPDANFKSVVRPNFDTLYSSLWIDLTEGPVIVSVPDSEGRYYLLPMLDMWTDVFASPGRRTTGTKSGLYAYVPPGWQGNLPNGVTRIDAPTPYGWMIGRTQTNGPKDYENVHKFQDGLKVTKLSEWGKQPTTVQVKIDPTVDMETPPLIQVNNMPAKQFFEYAARLMTLHPPHTTDSDIVARMKRIGIVAGEDLDFDKLDKSVRDALEKVPAIGVKTLQAKVPTLARVVNGWSMNTDTMGVYGTYFLKRAAVTMVGLGANKPEDAVYPLLLTDSDGKTPTGDNKYVIHFKSDQLPPVNAFWSVTMYDEDGFQVANAINRFAIGDRDELMYNSDGSLDLYIQHDKPAADKQSNWLPTPAKGVLALTMRLYSPKRQVIDGSWAPPPLERIR